MEQFQEGVTEIMMACEELRQPFKDKSKKLIAADVLLTGREDLDFIFQNLGGMHQQLHQIRNHQLVKQTTHRQHDHPLSG